MSIKTVGSKSEKVRKRLVGVCALTLSLTAMLSLTGASLPHYRYVVNESVNGTVTQLAIAYTDSDSPYEILQAEQIELENGDTYEFTEASHTRQGTITIKRAFPVYITIDGQTKEVMLQDGTVADALKSAWITLGENDIVSVSLDEQAVSGMSVTVSRVVTKTVTREKEVAYETDYETTNSVVANAKVKVSEGVPGIETYTYEETYIDGELQESKFISKEITKEPVNEIYMIGSTKNVISDYDVPADLEFDENGNPVNYKKKVTGKATAYSTNKKTSLIEGCVAMDLSKYPRGTWLYIKSSDGSYVYGYCKVADTGTALIQGRVLVDVFYDTFAECYQFGARTLDVYVLS